MTCGPSPVGRQKRLAKRDRKCAKMLGMETRHRQLRLTILDLLRKMPGLKVITIPKPPSFSSPKFTKSETPLPDATLAAAETKPDEPRKL